MSEFLVNTITHPAFGAVTFLLGILLGDHFAVSRDRRKEFNEASTKFRAAFKNELLALDASLTENTVDPADLLRAAFDKHRSAVFDFRLFLEKNKRIRFDQAWRTYYGYDESQEVEIEFLLKYSGKGYGGEEKRKRRSLALANIEKLLEFAEHK